MVIQVGQTRQKKKKKIKIKCKIAKKKNFDNWPLQVTVTLLSLVRHVQGISYRWWFPFHLLNLQTAPAKQRYSPQRSEAHRWKRSRLTSIMRWVSSDLSSSPSISQPFSDIPAKGPCRGWHRYNPQELQHPVWGLIERNDSERWAATAERLEDWLVVFNSLTALEVVIRTWAPPDKRPLTTSTNLSLKLLFKA